jgi:hypothetical protein
MVQHSDDETECDDGSWEWEWEWEWSVQESRCHHTATMPPGSGKPLSAGCEVRLGAAAGSQATTSGGPGSRLGSRTSAAQLAAAS